MIHGVGTDIVAVARVRDTWERHGSRFAERLLGEPERADFARTRDFARFLAKRFAAKEAFAKALGTGVRPPATLHAIMVAHDDLGRPVFHFDVRLTQHLAERQLRAHLSISDEVEFVVAFALLEATP
ncbi:MAG: holo-ACP synthase [Zoogloeaceae bacterium]|nr:holo-ACP synthase [Zoogloeaceae bacterium]